MSNCLGKAEHIGYDRLGEATNMQQRLGHMGLLLRHVERHGGNQVCSAALLRISSREDQDGMIALQDGDDAQHEMPNLTHSRHD